MYLRHRSKIINVLLKPRFSAIIILWLAGSFLWWYVSKIMVQETHPRAKFVGKFNKDLIVENDIPVCDTIHIALVCMGKCTQVITPMLKSLLYHRQNPLHFHLVVDYPSDNVLKIMFKTWELPDVSYTCYKSSHFANTLRWIPNSHYSGIYAMTKLLFSEILPYDLKRVIVLDSDLTFTSDVAELWHLFKYMNTDQFIGLVENESDWYLDTEKRWPAIGRGFNTGVMLLDLQKMRKKDWHKLWETTVKKCLQTYVETTLADQDVINAVIFDNPKIVYKVSCHYNIQMSVKNVASSCYDNDNKKVKIIHWNSPFKQNVKLKEADYFRNIYEIFFKLDGHFLRTKLYVCNKSESQTSQQVNLSTGSLCDRLSAASRLQLRTHINYMDFTHIVQDNFDVTLVLQLSIDRMTFFERLARSWHGPISAAIYLSDCDVTAFDTFINQESETLRIRRNIGYHLVFKHDLMHYPVNYLRNVALENVVTPYVFLIDVDFVPMINLYSHLRAAIRLINPYPQKKCLVVAAFETQLYRSVPAGNKPALLAQLARGSDVAAFRAREWPRGHRATLYAKWLHAQAPYEVEWQADYEPYLVVHRTVPKFDTRFSGFGWNKVSHSFELRAQGYRPVVLPDAFIVHTPHAPSQDIVSFRNDVEYRECLTKLKEQFMQDLKDKYNVTFSGLNDPEPDESIRL